MRIFVRTLHGSTLAIEADYNEDTVLDIKKRILSRNGIPIENQKLVFAGSLLEDSHLISHYRIETESTLNLICKSDKMMISVSIKRFDEQPDIYEVPACHEILFLKKLIFQKTSIPVEFQKLFYKHSYLDDTRKIEDYDFDSDVILYTRDDIIMITVEVNHEKYKFHVDANLRIKELKNQIYELSKIQINRQKLFHLAKHLDNEKSLKDLEISSKAEINCVILSDNRINVTIIMLDNTRQTFEVQDDCKIIDLKTKIQQQIFVPFEQLDIFHDDQNLENNIKIETCKIDSGETLYLKKNTNDEISFYARNEYGVTYLYKMSLDCTVKYIKEQIYINMGIPEKFQQLFYLSTLMKDHESLRKHRILSNCIINLIDIDKISDLLIYVKMPDESVQEYAIRGRDTMLALKKKIFDRNSIITDLQLLKCNSKHIDNNEKCSEYANSVVVLKIKNDQKEMTVFVRTLAGNTSEYQVNKWETILDLKKLIYQKTTFLPKRQKLVSGGIYLEDDRTFECYGIEDQTRINIIISLRGG